MKNYPLWKTILVIIVITLGIVFSIPSIIYNENSSHWFLENKINLGLDLQGGSYLLLQVESDVLVNEHIENISDSVRQISREKKILIPQKANNLLLFNNFLNPLLVTLLTHESFSHFLQKTFIIQTYRLKHL